MRIRQLLLFVVIFALGAAAGVAAVTSRRLNPPDPSKPIDTRVLLVKVAFAESAPLKLGQRVEVAFE